MKLTALASLAMLATSSVALANPVLLGSTSDPTGITGVVVNGTTYDVSFSTESFNELFSPSSLPAFWQDSSSASDAAAALADDLDSLGVAGLEGLTCGERTGFFSRNACQVIVPFDTVNLGILSAVLGDGADNSSGSWSTGGILANSVIGLNNELGITHTLTGDVAREYAVFSAASTTSVPEPSTLALLGLGLAALGLTRRRRLI